jgi:hypothetical protein
LAGGGGRPLLDGAGMLRLLPLLALALCAGMGQAAAKYRFAPFKDELFKYPKVLSSGYDGAFTLVEFVQSRDLDGRDEVPEKKAKAKYVSLDVDQKQKDQELDEGKLKVPFVEVGDINKPVKAVFIFVHGDKGNRFQGVDDWTFGGNFNRLKNLMVRNQGLYLSPGVIDDKETGKSQVRLLVNEVIKNSPKALIFVGCASSGGQICWSLFNDPAISPHLGGMLLLGATTGYSFVSTSPSPNDPHPIPIYIGHGNQDKIISWKIHDRLFKTIEALRPGYPIRFVVFDGGKHGTPMRMTDWRLVLNWMLEVDGV